MDKLKWKWVYIPYLDAPDKQKESAIKAGYAKVYFKSEVDASIARLEDKIQMHDFFWEGCGFAKRGFKNTIAVAQYVEDLEAKLKDAQRWRKVSEELPKDGAEVLATDGYRIWLCYKTTMCDGSPWFQPDGLPHIIGVTHWMPLPKAPEKGHK